MASSDPGASPPAPANRVSSASAPDTRASDATGSVYGPGSARADADYAGIRESLKLAREAEAADQADAEAGVLELRRVLGHETPTAVALTREFLQSLPAAEREEIEGRVLSDGTLALNDPEFVLQLWQRALGPLPSGQALLDEIAAMEKRMGVEWGRWHKDTKAQQRYRMLVRLRDGA